MSDRPVEVMARAIGDAGETACQVGGLRSQRMTDDWLLAISQAALAALEQAGYVVAPKEISDEMRYACWFDQARHVGATVDQAHTLAKRYMTDRQRAMDRSAYRAMLSTLSVGEGK